MKNTENQHPEGDYHDTSTKPRYRQPSHFIQKGNNAQKHFPCSILITPIDLPSKNISMSLVALEPGQQTDLVRHTYENIIYVLEGRGYSEIEGNEIDWEAGDALVIPSWAWHGHQNLDMDAPARLLVCNNFPQLEQLGLALKEVERKPINIFKYRSEFAS